jgi:hypothetical protein
MLDGALVRKGRQKDLASHEPTGASELVVLTERQKGVGVMIIETVAQNL